MTLFHHVQNLMLSISVNFLFFTCSLYIKSMATWSLDNVLDLIGYPLGSLQPVIGSWAVSILCIYQTLGVVLDKAVFLLGTFSWPFYMVGW